MVSRERMTSICVSPGAWPWLTSRGKTRNVVISMTADQPTPRRRRALQAVRRAARALKSVNDEQVLMWETFWRASRFPAE